MSPWSDTPLLLSSRCRSSARDLNELSSLSMATPSSRSPCAVRLAAEASSQSPPRACHAAPRLSPGRAGRRERALAHAPAASSIKFCHCQWLKGTPPRRTPNSPIHLRTRQGAPAKRSRQGNWQSSSSRRRRRHNNRRRARPVAEPKNGMDAPCQYRHSSGSGDNTG